MPVIAIEGNIGASKSTQIELIRSRLALPVFPEPIHRWPLANFYSDRSAFALPLQLTILGTSQVDAKYLGPDHFIVTERSHLSARNVFWQNLVDNNIVPLEEHSLYSKAYDALSYSPSIVIYLRTSSHICLDRISTRSQPGDNVISLDLLTALGRLYDRLLLESTDPSFPTVYTVDTDNKTDTEIHLEITTILRSTYPCLIPLTDTSY